jgi:hypothetical protein
MSKNYRVNPLLLMLLMSSRMSKIYCVNLLILMLLMKHSQVEEL